MIRTLHPLLALTVVFASAGVAGCAGLPTGVGWGGERLTCDDLGAAEDARRVQAFLDASARFESETWALTHELEATCASMAADLGVTVPPPADGQLAVEAACGVVTEEIASIVESAYGAGGGSLEVVYAPPVCEVDLEAMGACVARCDATISSASSVTCAEGVGGAACYGERDTRADARCEAACEAEVRFETTCTEPELEVVASAATDVEDQVRLDALVATLDAHYPHFVALESQLIGVMQSGADLIATFEGAADATGRLGARAMACFADSMAASAHAMATVEVSVSVSVELSASVPATAG